MIRQMNERIGIRVLEVVAFKLSTTNLSKFYNNHPELWTSDNGDDLISDADEHFWIFCNFPIWIISFFFTATFS